MKTIDRLQREQTTLCRGLSNFEKECAQMGIAVQDLEKKLEKKAFRPKYKAAKDAYFKVVEERNSHVGRKGGIPKDVLDRYRKASEIFRPFQIQMASYDRRRSETHGFVWVYLRKQKTVASKPVKN